MIAAITLHDESHRRRALAMVTDAPKGHRLTIAEPKRSDAQNDKMWAMIGQIMKQKPDWFGPGMDADDIKQIFMSAYFKELRVGRNTDGNGLVPLTRRSSKMSVKQMGEMLEQITVWCVVNEVTLHDQAEMVAA